MQHILIISTNEKINVYVKDFLHSEDHVHITFCKESNKARRLVLEHAFDIILMNYPLMDDTSYDLPLDLAKGCDATIFLLVNQKRYDGIVDKMEQTGIYVIGKPINKQVLSLVLRFAFVTQKRIAIMQHKTKNLSSKLQEIKLIDRAKCLLMEKEHLSEQQAHRYLEKKAMDQQCTRFEIAKRLIEKYQHKKGV